MPLPRDFYAQPTLLVAEQLLGKLLVRVVRKGEITGRIVEVEAYIGEEDPACHAARGPTRRNSIMYGEPGHAYVYFTYGMHYMLNFVTEPEGFPAAVLIRALEPLDGVGLMRRSRKRRATRELTSGPGKLCQALKIDLSLNGADLCRPPLYVEDSGTRPEKIIWAERVGIREGCDRLWRCYVAGNPFVSIRAKNENFHNRRR